MVLTLTSNYSGEYQGWSNWETWCVNLWIGNELDLYEDLVAIIQERTTIELKAKHLSEVVEVLIDEEIMVNSLSDDLVTRALERVNWEEIIRNRSTDLEEVRDESI